LPENPAVAAFVEGLCNRCPHVTGITEGTIKLAPRSMSHAPKPSAPTA
jgi:hypothetical protein